MRAHIGWMEAEGRGGAANTQHVVDVDDGERSLAADADWQAWCDERVAAAIAAQDDAELVARQWGPEPEFMLAAGGDHAR